MHDGRDHDEDVEDVVRAAAEVETARLAVFGRHEGLWEAVGVDGRAEDEEHAFEQVVWHPGRGPGALEAVHETGVQDGEEAGEAGRDEDSDAEGAVLAALEAALGC